MYSGTKSPGTVYWTPIAPNMMKSNFTDNDHIDGGFPWEPFFSDIVSSVSFAASVGTSDQLEPNHPCCMVAAKESFLLSNEAAVLRFLSAYMEAVDEVNKAIANPGSAEYIKLVDVSMKFTGITDPIVINNSFLGLTYSYELKEGLEEYVSGLVVDFERLGTITKHVDDPTAFANSFINRKYIDKVTEQKTEEYPSQKVRIRVGHLAGDIHQICLMYAVETGIFEKYGVELVRSLYPNGPGVMNAFQLGVIDIGLLGLPPAVINTANFR
jgi:ABC-type nitrate/sulfonate/bicarbonate transport system substrate-binding protein